ALVRHRKGEAQQAPRAGRPHAALLHRAVVRAEVRLVEVDRLAQGLLVDHEVGERAGLAGAGIDPVHAGAFRAGGRRQRDATAAAGADRRAAAPRAVGGRLGAGGEDRGERNGGADRHLPLRGCRCADQCPAAPGGPPFPGESMCRNRRCGARRGRPPGGRPPPARRARHGTRRTGSAAPEAPAAVLAAIVAAVTFALAAVAILAVAVALLPVVAVLAVPVALLPVVAILPVAVALL